MNLDQPQSQQDEADEFDRAYREQGHDAAARYADSLDLQRRLEEGIRSSPRGGGR